MSLIIFLWIVGYLFSIGFLWKEISIQTKRAINEKFAFFIVLLGLIIFWPSAIGNYIVKLLER